MPLRFTSRPREGRGRRIVLEAAALAQFREQVAREYVSREAMRELEERVVKAIDRVGDRLDRLIAPAKG